jgi:5-methylcytosine-specific restriction endonuclease McrA
VTSASWEDVASGYRRYRELPLWIGPKDVPNNQGLLSRELIRDMKVRGAKAAAEVEAALARLVGEAALPETPRALEQRHVDGLAAKRRLGRETFAALWEAIVFDRGGYTCAYCGRTPASVSHAEGRRRGLSLVVDHFSARSTLAERRRLDNSVTACASCRAVKADLPRDPFLDELRSLASAVAARHARSEGARGEAAG